jgi:hypothetical protein
MRFEMLPLKADFEKREKNGSRLPSIWGRK